MDNTLSCVLLPWLLYKVLSLHSGSLSDWFMDNTLSCVLLPWLLEVCRLLDPFHHRHLLRHQACSVQATRWQDTQVFTHFTTTNISGKIFWQMSYFLIYGV